MSPKCKISNETATITITNTWLSCEKKTAAKLYSLLTLTMLFPITAGLLHHIVIEINIQTAFVEHNQVPFSVEE